MLRYSELQTVAGRAAKQKQEKRATRGSNNEPLESADPVDGTNRWEVHLASLKP